MKVSSERSRAITATMVVFVSIAGVGAFVIGGTDARSQNGADPAAGAWSTDSGALVPKGPRISFCPSPEQSDAHLEQYGFDYKPQLPEGIACTDTGEYHVPAGTEVPDPPKIPERDRCEQPRAKQLSAVPIPNDDPLTMEGELRDGTRVGVSIDGSAEHFAQEGIHDINGWAKSYKC